MSRKTSISLSDDQEAVLRSHLEAGDSLRAIILRGLELERVDEAQARLVAQEALEALGDELQDRIDRAVERALRRMQGG